MAVLWRLRYKPGCREVAKLLLQRGFEISHETIRMWDFRFAPYVTESLQKKRHGRSGRSWYLDETYVKVSGRWSCLYWAIDGDGNLLDSMLNEKRDKYAARRFLHRLLDRADKKPLRLTTDKHAVYTKAIRWIVGRKTLHRYNRYLNNPMDQHHRHIKQRYYPILGFGSSELANRFCPTFAGSRNYVRVNSGDERITTAGRRKIFRTKWSNLLAELSA